MISCKKATELISKSMDEELSFKEQAQLKIHLYICEFCDLFKKQIGLLRNALTSARERDEHNIMSEEIQVKCEDAKKRLKEKFKS